MQEGTSNQTGGGLGPVSHRADEMSHRQLATRMGGGGAETEAPMRWALKTCFKMARKASTVALLWAAQFSRQ